MTGPVEDVEVGGDEAQVAIGNKVHGDLVQQQIKIVRAHPRMVMTEEQIRERVSGYVPAHNHDEIIETLHRHQAVAVTGPRGAGTVTTAVAALRHLRPGMPIRYFSTDKDDPEEIKVAGAQGYLVRARDESKTRLWDCLAQVRAAGGYLLLVGRPEECEAFTGIVPAIEVKPPSPEDVYRRRLAVRGLDGTAWITWERAGRLLEGGLPGDGRRLADLVLDVTGTGGDASQVERAYLGWVDELRAWFGAHPDLREKALMVAAATITPADETSVYEAALWLARELKVPLEGGGLSWCPSAGLAAMLDAERRDENTIEFRRQEYRESVLRYIWREYPLTRMDLLRWLSKLAVEGTGLKVPLRNRLAEVFAELAAGHGYAEEIAATARRWIEHGQLGANLAYIVLANTCLDPVVGGRIRTQLYNWSLTRSTPQTLKLIIARVCQVIGQAHVPIALTRLKHLATYGDEQVRDEVLDVAVRLAEQDRVAVVTAALRWCEPSRNQRLSKADRKRRTTAGLRLLCAFLDGDGPADPYHLRRVLDVLRTLADRGGAELTPLVRETARRLAERHRAAVLESALAWAAAVPTGGMDGEAASAAKLGTELFLGLAAERDRDGLAAILTGEPAVDPCACSAPWAVAVAAEPPPLPPVGTVTGPAMAHRTLRTRSRESGYAAFEDAAHLWLDTAAARPDLRPRIVEVFCQAAGRDPVRSEVVVDLVRRWAGTAAAGGRRDVRDRVLVRLLRPEWRRLLPALRLRLFGSPG